MNWSNRNQFIVIVCASLFVVAPLLAQTNSSTTSGILSANELISSEKLGYDLQYRFYFPAEYSALEKLPVIYLTDGQWYVRQGDLPNLMDRLIEKGKIQPMIAVFVDNRDPHNLSDNRRNRQFWCSENYAAFFEQELIPEIDNRFKTAANRSARVILGLSFGGLNSVCFGLHAHNTFEGIAIQSPAMRPVPSIFSAYEDSTRLPLKIFLSTGTRGDNEESTRRLKRILDLKKYEMKYVEVPYDHSWANWKPLLDDVLLYYFATD